MNIVLWIIAGILSLAFMAAGAMKLSKSRPELSEMDMEWVDSATDGQVKTLGALEVAGGIGVLLPGLVDVAPILVPIAATGLAIMMLGALVVHARGGDGPKEMAPAIVLGALAAFLAIGRFAIETF